MRSTLFPLAGAAALLLGGCALVPAADSTLRASQSSASETPAETPAEPSSETPQDAPEENMGDGTWPTDHDLFDAVVASVTVNAEPGSFALAVAAPFERWQASDDIAERRFLDFVRQANPDYPEHLLDVVADATDTGPVRGAFAHPAADGHVVLWTVEAMAMPADATAESWLSGRRGSFLELSAVRDGIEPTSDDDALETWTTDHGTTIRRGVAERRHDLGWIVSVHIPSDLADTDHVAAFTKTLRAFTTPGIQEAA